MVQTTAKVVARIIIWTEKILVIYALLYHPEWSRYLAYYLIFQIIIGVGFLLGKKLK
jgi:hypothetical protein